MTDFERDLRREGWARVGSVAYYLDEERVYDGSLVDVLVHVIGEPVTEARTSPRLIDRETAIAWAVRAAGEVGRGRPAQMSPVEIPLYRKNAEDEVDRV